MSETAKPFFTRQQLVKLIWPLLLEQFLAVTMGLADTFMVSSVGEAAVSSVSLVDTLNVLVLQILAALASGGAVVVSQYAGQKNTASMKKCAAQLYSVLLISTVAVMVLAAAGSRWILRVIFGQIDDAVMAYAQTYFFISAISYPFMGAYNAGAALFRAQGNSRVSMKASLVMNVINILGNAMLIYGLRMGVLGAALATLAGRVFAAVWVTMQQQKLSNPFRIEQLADMKPERQHTGHWHSKRTGKRDVPDRKALCQQPDCNAWNDCDCSKCRSQYGCHGGKYSRQYDRPCRHSGDWPVPGRGG